MKSQCTTFHAEDLLAKRRAYKREYSDRSCGPGKLNPKLIATSLDIGSQHDQYR